MAIGTDLRRTFVVGLALASALTGFTFATSSPLHAEATEIRLARQFGMSYLQTIIMEKLQLVEKHVGAAGLKDVRVRWNRFSNGPAMNDALLSGNLDFADGGVTSLIVLWDKSKGAYLGLAPLSSMPAVLTTRDPNIKSIRDYTDKDRIALPAVRVSMQAIILDMIAEETFGKGQQGKLDHLTVTLPHPDAAAALIGGGTEITSHFTAAPYYYEEEKNPQVHPVLSSYDYLGGPATYAVMWASKEFMRQNPKVTAAVLAATEEATQLIKDDPARAAKLYIEAEDKKMDPALAERIIRDPDNVFTTTPQRVMKFADFMHRTGLIKNKVAEWKDLFSPLIAEKPGS